MLATKSNVAKSRAFAPQLPWNTYEADELGPNIMEFLLDQEPFYRRWAQRWYENFQFLFGNQNIKWSRRNDFAVDYDYLLRRTYTINARVQTNLVRTITEALGSYIFGNLPEWDVESMDESATKGTRFKTIAEKILECYAQRLCMDVEFNIGSIMFALFGQCAWKIDWNANGGSLLEIPRWKKARSEVFRDYMAPNQLTGGLIEVPTPVIGSEGMPIQQDRWEKAVDAFGRQIVDKVMSGDVFVDSLSPFEYRRPIGSRGMHKDKWIQQILIMDYDEYLDFYENVPGRTRNWDKVRPIFSDQTLYAFAAKHYLRMQFTTPPTLSENMRRTENVFRNAQFRQKVIVIEHYDKPHPTKWPLGRKVVVTNGVCTHITTPTYNTNKLDGWHPFVEAQWMRVAPSSIASGPISDVVQKNRELNVKDSLVATAVRRNMGSVLLCKTGNGVDKDQLTGDPGQVVETQDPFAFRWLHDDLPIPPIMGTLRQNDKDDVYEVSGAGDVLRGERAKGVSSGYQQRQIQESEEKRLTPARINWEQSISGVGMKLLSCLKTNAVSLGPDVMSFLMRSAAGKFTPQDVVAFLTNTIDYGTEIRVRKSSMAFKSEATELATLQELSQNPAVAQRLGMDAKVLDEYLKKFGVKTFRDRSGPQRDRAGSENETFADMMRLGPDTEGLQTPIVLFEDDDTIHMAEHAEFLIQNADEIMGNKWFMTQFLMHIEMHRIQDQEKQAQLLPGSSLQVPTMMGMATKMQPPTAQTVAMDSMMRKQQAAQNPQAPKLPSEPGAPPGAKPQDPSAPPAQTKQGAMDR